MGDERGSQILRLHYVDVNAYVNDMAPADRRASYLSTVTHSPDDHMRDRLSTTREGASAWEVGPRLMQLNFVLLRIHLVS